MNIQLLLQTGILPRVPNFSVGSPITFLVHAARFTTGKEVISVWWSIHASETVYHDTTRRYS